MSISTHTPHRLWNFAKARTTAAAGLVVAGSLLLGSLPGAFAAPVDKGYRDDQDFGTSVRAPTAEKPESKLWYNDGSWYASMYTTETFPGDPARDDGYYIHKLNLATKDWELYPSATEPTLLDGRNSSSADVLWDQATSKLYVASHIQDGDSQPNDTGAGNEKRLFRYSYSSATKSYTLDGPFAPDGVKIADNSSETLVIAKETSANRIWATWVESPIENIDPVTGPSYGSAKVMVARSDDGGQTWTAFSLADGAPNGPGLSSATVTTDDISTIIAYNGRIGVMWSNQDTRKTYFATHTDGAANTAWNSTVVYEVKNPDNSPAQASDDHLNIKLQAVGNKLFAVTKTNLGSDKEDIVLLACVSGDCTSNTNWSAYNVYGGDTPSLEHTRPVLLVDTTTGAEKLHIFTAQPSASSAGAQAIYRKSVAIAGLSQATVDAAVGTPFISSTADPEINNPTTTKQSVNSTTGMVVLASDDSTNSYLWNFDALDNTPPPAPTATPAGGTYATAQDVTLSNTEAGVTIYYTTDGSDPQTSATRQLYSAPISIATTTTLKFYAEDDGGNKSSVVTEVYTITPPVTPSSKVYLPLIISNK